jgi:hypothetical protein
MRHHDARAALKLPRDAPLRSGRGGSLKNTRIGRIIMLWPLK